MALARMRQHRRHLGEVLVHSFAASCSVGNVYECTYSMPQFCAAFGCTNKRTVDTRRQGITFHKFPSIPEVKRSWEIALKRKGFEATKYSVLCSEHFKPEDFDRTGQTVRLRDKVVPTVFNFPQHSVKQSNKPRTTASSTQAAAASLDPVEFVDSCDHSPASESVSPRPAADHVYALPPSPGSVKRKLVEAESRVAELERKLRNATDRERRSKKNLKCMIAELKQKNLLTNELEHKLELYSDLPLEVLGKESSTQYSTRQREFALTLHLNGPKAYKYLRDDMKLPLPHPHTLQR